MNRAILIILLLLLLPGEGFAARRHLDTSSRDPYVSALALDADTGKVFFESNSNTPVWPASVLKSMTLAVILDQLQKGRISLSDMVQITPEAASMGGSQVYLDPKESFSVEDLLYALMVQSANDAAVALALHAAGSTEAFVEMMNNKAKELGMTHSHFYTVHGLPPSKGQDVDVTTAQDLALLAQYLVKNPLTLKLASTKEKDFRNGEFIMRNHNNLLDDMVECDGLKTGYFKAAGYSIVATAHRDGKRVIAIVMGSSKRLTRDARARELLLRGLTALRSGSTTTGSAVTTVTPQGKNVSADQQHKRDPGAAIQILESNTSPVPGATGAAPQAPGKESGHNYMTFIWGLLAGLALCLIVLVLYKRRRQSPYRYNR
ncbi:D-alanyl-D-alanine carboxypeptidase [Desulforhopalus vacuolatus]|uniref:D-alanyl-D-alanine carboxypeptidase family protein n=1 Tax=Desulforhopalus vacuolatus TaxID=40414 RepID=UPI001962D97B|nr:D-alanyl-D-alanine carboxypeptidase family protein [Desulforhopalus vacuolatus]MBM9518239.1 D-alanyl-D-alanine carboxypeptidase [Desulforhopalus vacuolatus]